MKEDIVKGFAVKIVFDGQTRYVHSMSSQTCYTTDLAPCVFSSKEKALQALAMYDKLCPTNKGELVEVECRAQVKSWVGVSDPDTWVYVHNQSVMGTAYMHSLALLMRDGKVRLTGTKWEVYQ